MFKLLCFSLSFFGLWNVFTTLVETVNPAVKKAVKSRMDKELSPSAVFISKMAKKAAPYISLDPIKKETLQRDLVTVNNPSSPEMFYAEGYITAALYSLSGVVLLLISVPLGLAVMLGCFFAIYNQEISKLQKTLLKRRKLIERELPQFSGTIRQNLNTTRDIVTILESYRKVCGETLLLEINKTLNDAKTGNAEIALKAFDARIASPKLSELVRGLIGLTHGDDQKLYFDLLTEDYIKAQNEEVKKELLARPAKLKPFIVTLLISMMLMFVAAIGGYMIVQFKTII
ncbi:MAG: hypothetical protein RR234_01245 [Christensenella sp.]